MTVQEYLAFEATAEEKHEFVNGEVVAMAGASPEHSAVTAGLSAALITALRAAGKPCLTLSSDTRVRISETGLYAYPDVTVVCGTPEFDRSENPPSLLNPHVIFEVLSDSTEAFDRGAKASHYRSRSSLQEYALIALVEPRVELYARAQEGSRWSWNLAEFRTDEQLPLSSLGITLQLTDVFAQLALLDDSG